MPARPPASPSLNDVRAAALMRYFDAAGTDSETTHAMYHEDAILEFPQSGERFIGRATFQAWRTQYPAKVDYRIRRLTIGDDLIVVELLVSYNDGPPVSGIGIERYRGDRIAHEIVYVADTWDPADWRAPWATMFDRDASIAASDWSPDQGFGLEAEARGLVPVIETSDHHPDASIRADLARHWEFEGVDFDRSHEIYAEDAVLEFPQSGERFIGRERFLEWRRQYPAKIQFGFRRWTGHGGLWVAENQISYDGGPWKPTLSVLQLRGGRVVREYLYVMDDWDAAEWRAPWATRFDRHAFVAPAAWREGVPFGLDAEMRRDLDDRAAQEVGGGVV